MNIKKVAAVHDLSGYGRASLTVVIPVLSYMGFQVCPLPTAILSAHSEYRDFRCFDLTDQMQPVIDHWKELNLKFDALYSGYLASFRQLGIVESFFKDFGREGTLILVDPVMGDHGTLYPGMDVRMVEGMKRLCACADVITPNVTEAALLLGKDLQEEITEEKVSLWCRELSDIGPEYCIITSAPSSIPEHLSTLAYNRRDGRLWRICSEHIPASYPGTGDAFASVIVGCLLDGDTLPEAIERAVYFINMGIRATFGSAQDPLDGMNQEKVLHYLVEPLPSFSYELLGVYK